MANKQTESMTIDEFFKQETQWQDNLWESRRLVEDAHEAAESGDIAIARCKINKVLRFVESGEMAYEWDGAREELLWHALCTCDCGKRVLSNTAKERIWKLMRETEHGRALETQQVEILADAIWKAGLKATTAETQT